MELCSFFDLWKVPTREVLFNVIVPLTSELELRCRFTELPMFAGSGVVDGLAVPPSSSAIIAGVVVLLLGTVSEEGRDGKDRVWLDILTVRQQVAHHQERPELRDGDRCVRVSLVRRVAVCPPELLAHSDTAIYHCPSRYYCHGEDPALPGVVVSL